MENSVLYDDFCFDVTFCLRFVSKLYISCSKETCILNSRKAAEAVSRSLSAADTPSAVYANPLFYLSSLIPKGKAVTSGGGFFIYKLEFILLNTVGQGLAPAVKKSLEFLCGGGKPPPYNRFFISAVNKHLVSVML